MRVLGAIASRARFSLNTGRFVVGTFTASVHRKPIFVLGNQKSGTTAIAALLAELTGLDVTLDLPTWRYRWMPKVLQVARKKISFARLVRAHRLSFSRPIIKEPQLTLLMPCLFAEYPESKFVYVLRDARDNIRSILNRLSLPGDLEELSRAHLEAVPRTWRAIFDYSLYGQPENNYVQQLAARWNVMIDVFNKYRPKFRLVRYEDFMVGKEKAIRRLAGDLGLEAVQPIRDKVDVQYQPAGDNSAAWIEYYGARNLGYIEDMCGSRLRALGYNCSFMLLCPVMGPVLG